MRAAGSRTPFARCLVRLLCVAGMSTPTMASPPPTTSVELTSYLTKCPGFTPDAWPAVDDLHDRLIADWRALPDGPSAWSQQRALESRFAEDVGAAAGISSDCIAVLKLALEEGWLRRRLAELRIQTCTPAMDGIVEDARLRLLPEVTEARAASIRALRAAVTEAERALVRGEAPRGASVFAPTDIELASIRSAAKCIDSLSEVAGMDAASVMRERLSAAIVRSPIDLPLARAQVILRHMRGLDGRQSDCVRQWLEGQRQRRLGARRELAARILGREEDARQLTELLRQGTGELDDLAEVGLCLPPESSEAMRALLGHWHAVEDPVLMARTLVGDRGAAELLELEPVSVEPVPVSDAAIRWPGGGVTGFESLWRSILARDLQPDELQRLRVAYVQWDAVQQPRLAPALAVAAAADSAAGPEERADMPQDRLAMALGLATAVRAMLDAEGQLAVSWPGTGVPDGADSLAHLERLGDALAAIPRSHVSTSGMQYPRALSPRMAISDAGLSPVERATAMQICVERATELLRSYQKLVHAEINAHVRDAERALDAEPSNREEAGCWRAVRVAWDAWLRECDGVRRDLQSALSEQASDAVMARWMVDCFPVIRDLTDINDVLGAAATPERARHRKLVSANLRELQGRAFAKRTGATWSEPSPDVGRITATLEQLRFDSDNLKERDRRIGGIR